MVKYLYGRRAAGKDRWGKRIKFLGRRARRDPARALARRGRRRIF
jgi:hypothetical protein